MNGEPDDDTVCVNCGRCGTPLFVRIQDLADRRTVECEACATRAPYSHRSVYVVFENDDDQPPTVKDPFDGTGQP